MRMFYAMVLVSIFVVSPGYAALIVSDDFERGVTTGLPTGIPSTAYKWVEIGSVNPGDGTALEPRMQSGWLRFTKSGMAITVVNTDDTALPVAADIEIVFDYRYNATHTSSDSFGTRVNYRVDETFRRIAEGSIAPGYMVRLARGPVSNQIMVGLYKDDQINDINNVQIGSTATVTVDGLDWGGSVEVRITAIGDSHKVYINEDLALDITDDSTLTAGYWSIGDGAWRHRAIDNFEYSVIPEPATAALLFAGLLSIGVRSRHNGTK